MKKACVIVFGEVSQSPRMQFHALSFAENGYDVDIIGYNTSQPYDQITNNRAIRIVPLNKFSSISGGHFLPIYLIIRIFWEMYYCIKAFTQISAPDIIIVQNPPSIILMPIILLLKLFIWHNVKIILDWHNYGYTLLSNKYSHYSFIKAIYKFIESQIGNWANYNICVSNAMKDDLYVKWGIKASTLYDFPQNFFMQSLSIDEMHNFLIKVFRSGKNNEKEGLFTVKSSVDSTFIIKSNRPALVISSTSWTEDEDFACLINAMDSYEDMKRRSSPELKVYPKLVCVVTGKGPLKSYYSNLIQSKSYRFVDFRLLWLEASDYPKLLACADLGICLHKSSSGLDLPMKISDMFGCGVPVLAYEYPTIHELVKPGLNGFLFANHHELCDRLKSLLQNLSDRSPKLLQMKEYISSHRKFWNENWNEVMLKLLAEGSNINLNED